MRSTFTRHILSLLLIAAFSATAQETSGRVMDAKTKEPIPFVTVQYGKNDGVITNMEGYFSFFNASADPQTRVTISAMGYRAVQLTVAEIIQRPTIALVEAVNQLETVYVSNKLINVDTLMARVRRNLPKNYNDAPAKLETFTRESAFFDPANVKVAVEKSTHFSKNQLAASNAELAALERQIINRPPAEAYTDIWSDLYTNGNKNCKLEIHKATKLMDIHNRTSFEDIQEKATRVMLKHLDTTKTYKLKTGLITVEDSLSLASEKKGKQKKDDRKIKYNEVSSRLYNSFQKAQFFTENKYDFVTEPENYEYTMEEITQYQNQRVYVVSFQPDRRRALFAGKLYITDGDYAIAKMEYAYAEGKTGEKVNLKLLLGIKAVEDMMQGTVIYSKDEATQTYFPKYINERSGQYIYVHRPLKFIENNNSNKNKVAFDLLLEGRALEQREILTLATSPITEADFSSFHPREDSEYKILSQYDPSQFKNVNSIEPLEAMKQFKAE